MNLSRNPAMPEEGYKIPIESRDYRKWSDLITSEVSSIMDNSIKAGDNKIFIHTNLRRGLPLKNINKVAASQSENL